MTKEFRIKSSDPLSALMATTKVGKEIEDENGQTWKIKEIVMQGTNNHSKIGLTYSFCNVICEKIEK